MKDKSQKIQKPYGYLWRISHNQLASWITDKSKFPIAVGLNDEIDGVDTDFDNLRTSLYQERIINLKQCIQNQLKDIDCIIVEQSLIQEKDSQTVAQITGLTAANVRQRLKRAISKLRQKCRQIWQD